MQQLGLGLGPWEEHRVLTLPTPFPAGSRGRKPPSLREKKSVARSLVLGGPAALEKRLPEIGVPASGSKSRESSATRRNYFRGGDDIHGVVVENAEAAVGGVVPHELESALLSLGPVTTVTVFGMFPLGILEPAAVTRCGTLGGGTTTTRAKHHCEMKLPSFHGERDIRGFLIPLAKREEELWALVVGVVGVLVLLGWLVLLRD